MNPKPTRKEMFEKLFEAVSPEELTEVVDKILKALNKLKEQIEERASKDTGALRQELSRLSDLLGTKEQTLRSLIERADSSATSRLHTSLSELRTELNSVRNAIPELPDLAPLYDEISALNLKIAEVITQNPLAIRDALELLPKGQKLAREAIEGLPDELKKLDDKIEAIEISPASPGGMPTLRLHVGGDYVGNVRDLIFTGSGITSTVANGAITLVVSGGGSGSLTAMNTSTGTVDGSNTSFTFASSPVYVIADGVSYFNGKGCTISGTSVTFDVAPSQYVMGLV